MVINRISKIIARILKAIYLMTLDTSGIPVGLRDAYRRAGTDFDFSVSCKYPVPCDLITNVLWIEMTHRLIWEKKTNLHLKIQMQNKMEILLPSHLLDAWSQQSLAFNRHILQKCHLGILDL